MGLTISFDVRILTDYLASRPYTLRIFLIANVFAKAKDVLAQVASAFRAPAFAPIAA